MKERPILFSAPMVLALLAGDKTQTRRIVKPQPCIGDGGCWYPEPPRFPGHRARHYANEAHLRRGLPIDFSRYGQPGDRLWVQEACALCPHGPQGFHCAYGSDGSERFVHLTSSEQEKYGERKFPLRSTPGRFMYRSASRITLLVESVRVERLHDISDADARAEGIGEAYRTPGHEHEAAWTERDGFARLWRKINGPESWAANPWVWVIGFSRATP